MTANLIAKMAEPNINADMLIAKTNAGDYVTKVVPHPDEDPQNYTWADWITHSRADVKRMLTGHFGLTDADAETILNR